MKIKLNEDKLYEYITKKCKLDTKKCDLCGSDDFTYDPDIKILYDFNKQTFNPGEYYTFLVCITCQNCGHTILINAEKTGAAEIVEES